jgi:hypothetical protein
VGRGRGAGGEWVLRAVFGIATAAVILVTAVPAYAVDVVLYRGAPADPTVERSIRRAFRLQSGSREVVLRPLTSLVAEDHQLELLGDGREILCDRMAKDVADVASLVADAGRAIAYLEYGSASSLLSEVDGLLPCLQQPLTPELLSRHHFLSGLAAWYSEDEPGARAAFRQGLLVSPFLQWDADYPPDARPAFDSAVQDALQTERAMLFLGERVTSEGRLLLDGVEVDPRARSIPLFEGAHFAQWQGQGSATVRTLAWRVRPGGSIRLSHREDLLQALSLGATNPLEAVPTGQVLDEAATAGAVFIARPGPIWVFLPRAGAATWSESTADDLEVWRSDGRRMRDVGTVIAVGGAVTAVVGVVTALLGLQQAEQIHAQVYPPESPGGNRQTYDVLLPSHALAEAQVEVGWALAGIGGATTAAGVPLVVGGGKKALGGGFLRPARRGRR